METEKNHAGGTSITLFADDDLDRVPASHRDLLTPNIRRAFTDPIAHFGDVAGECPFPRMTRFLRTLLRKKAWILTLHTSDRREWSEAGFMFFADKVTTVEIAPAREETPAEWPHALRTYHSLVGCVRWIPFGMAGDFDATSMPLSDFPCEFRGMSVDPDRTFIFGGSLSGDMLFYTLDGRGGWFCHENGYLHALGTIEDTIEWVYGEFLAGRTPELTMIGWRARNRPLTATASVCTLLKMRVIAPGL